MAYIFPESSNPPKRPWPFFQPLSSRIEADRILEPGVESLCQLQPRHWILSRDEFRGGAALGGVRQRVNLVVKQWRGSSCWLILIYSWIVAWYYERPNNWWTLVWLVNYTQVNQVIGTFGRWFRSTAWTRQETKQRRFGLSSAWLTIWSLLDSMPRIFQNFDAWIWVWGIQPGHVVRRHRMSQIEKGKVHWAQGYLDSEYSQEKKTGVDPHFV